MTPIATGVDVSHHRGTVNWREVKASGINFAIVKATDGDSFVDYKFDVNWLGLRHAGLLRGAYHFYRPATDPHIQAQHYLSQVGDILHASDLPPVLDCEAYPLQVREDFYAQDLAERVDRVRTWLEVVGKATGRTPILYTNPATWQIVLGDDKTFTQYPLWIAHYDVAKPTVPADNWGGRGYTFWQQTYQASVPGINDGVPPVDFNVYKGNITGLNAWAGWVGPRPLPPAVTNAELFLALRRAAETLNIALPQFLENSGLAYLVNHPNRVYNGLAFEEMTFPAAQIALIKELLFDGGGGEHQMLPVNFTNQDMINAIYETAEQLEMAGWQLLTLAGLTDLVDDRNALYIGPLPKDMPGLNDDQRLLLNLVLGLEPEPTEPPPPLGEPTITPPETEGRSNAPSTGVPPSGSRPSNPSIEIPPIEAPTEPVNPSAATYPDKTNQDMINAFYVVAENYQTIGWSLLLSAGLTSLTENRTAIYTGPKIETMTVLSPPQQVLLAQALGVARDGGDFDTPYPGLLNQDMINIFYQAAQQHQADGWDWIDRANLTYMLENQKVRYEIYQGPMMDDLTHLSVDERDTLVEILAAAA